MRKGQLGVEHDKLLVLSVAAVGSVAMQVAERMPTCWVIAETSGGSENDAVFMFVRCSRRRFD